MVRLQAVPSMCNSAARAARRKYGRYMPYQRANVDQVPLPFVNDMDTTYEQNGADDRWVLLDPV